MRHRNATHLALSEKSEDHEPGARRVLNPVHLALEAGGSSNQVKHGNLAYSRYHPLQQELDCRRTNEWRLLLQI